MGRGRNPRRVAAGLPKSDDAKKNRIASVLPAKNDEAGWSGVRRSNKVSEMGRNRKRKTRNEDEIEDSDGSLHSCSPAEAQQRAEEHQAAARRAPEMSVAETRSVRNPEAETRAIEDTRAEERVRECAGSEQADEQDIEDDKHSSAAVCVQLQTCRTKYVKRSNDVVGRSKRGLKSFATVRGLVRRGIVPARGTCTDLLFEGGIDKGNLDHLLQASLVHDWHAIERAIVVVDGRGTLNQSYTVENLSPDALTRKLDSEVSRIRSSTAWRMEEPQERSDHAHGLGFAFQGVPAAILPSLQSETMARDVQLSNALHASYNGARCVALTRIRRGMVLAAREVWGDEELHVPKIDGIPALRQIVLAGTLRLALFPNSLQWQAHVRTLLSIKSAHVATYLDQQVSAVQAGQKHVIGGIERSGDGASQSGSMITRGAGVTVVAAQESSASEVEYDSALQTSATVEQSSSANVRHVTTAGLEVRRQDRAYEESPSDYCVRIQTILDIFYVIYSAMTHLIAEDFTGFHVDRIYNAFLRNCDDLPMIGHAGERGAFGSTGQPYMWSVPVMERMLFEPDNPAQMSMRTIGVNLEVLAMAQLRSIFIVTVRKSAMEHESDTSNPEDIVSWEWKTDKPPWNHRISWTDASVKCDGTHGYTALKIQIRKQRRELLQQLRVHGIPIEENGHVVKELQHVADLTEVKRRLCLAIQNVRKRVRPNHAGLEDNADGSTEPNSDQPMHVKKRQEEDALSALQKAWYDSVRDYPPTES
ncbi:hypothetical protein FVE85_3461 [Porphyridium purpureum]|uniref:Uncharacterized protein n=1 Tax=Porphyridium purpureum TaxID=35688 RepID=A0A5J4YIC8_PORPP|nr:hypothetical protein FVE85_3461 [Porphyridium purpureum]|eukprot:POR6731..scf228_30